MKGYGKQFARRQRYECKFECEPGQKYSFRGKSVSKRKRYDCAGKDCAETSVICETGHENGERCG